MKSILVKLLGALASFVVLVLVAHWLLQPRMAVLEIGSHVVVDLQSLGEYNSVLSMLELTECDSNEPVWRLEPIGEFIGLHAFQLRIGDNPKIPQEFMSGPIDKQTIAKRDFHRPISSAEPSYHATIPLDDNTFRLKNSVCYRIMVEPARRFPHLFRVSRTFVLE